MGQISTNDEVASFLSAFHVKLKCFDIVFRDNRGKKMNYIILMICGYLEDMRKDKKSTSRSQWEPQTPRQFVYRFILQRDQCPILIKNSKYEKSIYRGRY
jgi:hypothetical protein